jgi:hypothetical protein
MTKKDPQLGYQVPTAGKQSNSNQNASVGYKYKKSWNKNNGSLWPEDRRKIVTN